ncbi:serine/threonine protein phosphatase [Thiohalobacter thiocyanaticus]|uniref:Serine/threonine protein phosphatase n=1 Tax=Thiohalobacter thiocyanaticus TaxID=585455 RepID=A0A1Z4VR24_9GAMM|nr:PP2C family protein-serine/threonine phosphatase [Thiohalobacter thiocyanaticus]BAZ93788.1 serine/threonine protein phosphatase [Thiohalobacter thiocyanaticus]
MNTLDWLTLAVYQATNQRHSQEDRWVAQPVEDGYLLAVLDGHGGSYVADFAASRLAHYFRMALIRKLPLQLSAHQARREKIEAALGPDEIEAWIKGRDPDYLDMDLGFTGYEEADEAGKRAILDQVARDNLVDKRIKQQREKAIRLDPYRDIHDALRDTVTQLQSDFKKSHRTGSTLSLAYVITEENGLLIFTAQLGDSSIAILSPEGELRVTPDHSVQTCIADRERIQAQIDEAHERNDYDSILCRAYIGDQYLMNGGGDYGYGLAMTRALGDTELDGLLFREPELQDFNVPQDSLILGVTDGVHNAGNLEERHAAYREIAERLRAGESMEAIGTELVSRQNLTDNITMVALRPAPDPWPIVGTLDVWQDGETAYVLTQGLPEEYRDDIRVAGLFDWRALIQVDGDEGVKLWVIKRFERRKALRFEYRTHDRKHSE